MPFDLVSPFAPAGDQPRAIQELRGGLARGDRYQTLLGVTGSGKTMTMAHVIAAFNRPTLVLSHNKTLAAQLYGELKSFFPKSAVEFFISYYDYYQPEGGPVEGGDDVRHGHRLAGAGDAQQRLVAVTPGEPAPQLLDGARLIPRRRERGDEIEGHPGNLTDLRLHLGTGLAARHVGHALHAPDGADHLVQVDLVFDLDEHGAEHGPVPRRQLGRADVGAGLADGGADVGVQAAGVLPAH